MFPSLFRLDQFFFCGCPPTGAAVLGLEPVV